MSYSIALGSIAVWVPAGLINKQSYSCEQARADCRPQFVFSVPGQVRFRLVLKHVSACQSRSCRRLRRDMQQATRIKLNWLIKEQKHLGCLEIQAQLYHAYQPTLRRYKFRQLAQHLANCPLERCSQLRRALLLSVRKQLAPKDELLHRNRGLSEI